MRQIAEKSENNVTEETTVRVHHFDHSDFRDPFYYHELKSISAWISDYIYSGVWDKTTYSFPNFNGANVEVWEWISNFFPHLLGMKLLIHAGIGYAMLNIKLPLKVEILYICLNTLRPRRNEQHFADDIFKRIFFNENVWISIKISPKFVPKGPINNIPALV